MDDLAFVNPRYAFSLHQNTDGDGFADEAGVQNTWYTAVDHAGPVRLHCIYVYQTNTETNNKTVEVRVTWNGTAYTTAGAACADNDRVSCVINLDEADDVNAFGIKLVGPTEANFVDHTKSQDVWTHVGMNGLKVEFRSTDAAGTAQELNCQVMFEEMLEL